MTNHCTFKQCQALKEIGFDESVRDVYNKNGFIQHGLHNMNYNQGEFTNISAPTRYEVLQWAREKHGIDAWVRPYKLDATTNFYSYEIFQPNRLVDPLNNYPTYPEAESALVDKMIEIIKNK